MPGPPIPPPERASLVRPSLATLTSVFFRIGNTTFGGGLPTIAAMQREFVEQRLWLSPEDYALAFSLARVTPGTNVIAFCAAVGAQILGFAGALAGALAETVPSAVLAILMTQGYESWRTNVWVAAGLTGTIAAVAGMMWSSIYSLVSPHVGTVGNAIRAAAITLGAFIAVWKFGWGPLTIIALAAIVGMVWTEPEAS